MRTLPQAGSSPRALIAVAAVLAALIAGVAAPAAPLVPPAHAQTHV